MSIELQAGDLRLVLDAETGGAIAAFIWRDMEILRPVRDARLAEQRGRAVAAYPLIPFANRLAGGRLRFAGHAYQLALNFGDDPNTIHGNAWMRAWTVADQQAAQARLTLAFSPAGDAAGQWPFAYAAEQLFALDATGLRITMSLRNTDNRAFPAGLGLHPYVARTPGTRLRFEADTYWTTDAGGLPVAREAVGGALAFGISRALGSTEIDTCYAGWSGEATVEQPEDGVALTLSATPPLDHLQLYTPAERDFIGLEPVSNMPDAFGRMDDVADAGLVVLQPGDSISATITLRVQQMGT